MKPSWSLPEFTCNYREKGNKAAGDVLEEYNYHLILFHNYSIIMKNKLWLKAGLAVYYYLKHVLHISFETVTLVLHIFEQIL